MPLAKRKALSLVELVIVIVILGIIAAVAIPRISSGSKTAGESALRANLTTIRSAIECYYLEHKQTLPAAKGDGVNALKTQLALSNQLTKYTNADGVYSEDKDPGFPFGPYIRNTFPAQTVGSSAGKNTVKIMQINQPLVANNGEDFGWLYNIITGQFIANCTELGPDGKPFSSW